MKPIDKVLLLQELSLFARTTADELFALAAIARELPLIENESVFNEGDPPALHIVLSGEISVQPPDGQDHAEVVRAGDAVGLHETLAGTPFDWRAKVVKGGMALRIERDRLFEVLSDQEDLLQALFSALFQSAASGPTHVSAAGARAH